jgi:hypothetical protein
MRRLAQWVLPSERTCSLVFAASNFTLPENAQRRCTTGSTCSLEFASAVRPGHWGTGMCTGNDASHKHSLLVWISGADRMKLSPRKPSSKLAVRAITALTGAAALTVGAVPAAQASPVPGHPFKLWVYTGASVGSLRVTGFKGNGSSYTTSWHRNTNHSTHNMYMGSDWRNGRFIVQMNYPGRVHECKTADGDWYGHSSAIETSPQGNAISYRVFLTHSGGTFLGIQGSAEC